MNFPAYVLLYIFGLFVLLGTSLLVILPSKIKIIVHVAATHINMLISVKPVFFKNFTTIFDKNWKEPFKKFETLFYEHFLTLLQGEAKPSSPLSPDSEFYGKIIDKFEKTIDLDAFSIKGKIGLQDACNTALFCGGLTALGSILCSSFEKHRLWYIKFEPVYHRFYFALKTELVVRVSLLNVISIMLFLRNVVNERGDK